MFIFSAIYSLTHPLTLTHPLPLGHALYEMGRNLDDEWRDLPVSQALSMGVHESQSLFYENHIFKT